MSYVVAGIVTYNPDINRLRENIRAVTLLYEENKCDKFKQMVRGIRDYRIMLGGGKETHNEDRV